jgi:hypothetical protein
MSAYIKLSTGEYPRHIGDIHIDPAGMAPEEATTLIRGALVLMTLAAAIHPT